MMDFSNPTVMLSGGLISLIGLGIFIYGKRMDDIKSLGIGLGMMVFPMFVHSVLIMWAIAGICAAWLYFGPRSA